MSILTGSGKIMPNDYEYHGVRILRFKCGCGKIHTFKKVIEHLKNEI